MTQKRKGGWVLGDISDKNYLEHLNKCLSLSREIHRISQSSVKIMEFWDASEKAIRLENPNVPDKFLTILKDMFFEGVSACLNVHRNAGKPGSGELMAFSISMMIEDVHEYTETRKKDNE